MRIRYILFIILGVCFMVNCNAGDLAMKYETGGQDHGVGYISNGSKWGDPGGDSYGCYQLETKQGTMQEYLHGNDRFTNALKVLKVNSSEFKTKWKELALEDPIGFKESQFMFIANKSNGYNKAIEFANMLGWNTNNFAMQSAIFSTCNQSGGWKAIFVNAAIYPNDDIVTQINKLYDARADYFRDLRISPTIKRNIIKNRTVDERKDCLKLINVEA